MAQENVVSIYKIDTQSFFFSECSNDFVKIIEKIVDRGNHGNALKRKSGKAEIHDYELMDIKDLDSQGFNIRLYHGSRDRQNSWNGFLSSVLKNNNDLFLNRDHDFIVFAYDEECIFCFTGGIASNLVGDVCDEDFPKEIMLRLSDPSKIKEAKSRGLTGAFYARSFYFRGDYSISPAEAFGSVWKDICISLRDSIKNDEDWKLIIGESKKRKINCDIKNSFKIRKRVSFETTIKLIKKIQNECKRELTDEEKQGFHFLDTIKIIKNKEIKNKLNSYLIKSAFEFLSGNSGFPHFDYDFCHKDYSNFLEASSYRITRGRDELCIINEINNAEQVLNEIKDQINLTDFSEFTSDFCGGIKVLSQHEDEFKDTNGTILDHLHGEILLDGKTYFLLDKEWCLIQDNFLKVLSDDFKDFVKNNIINEIKLKKWMSGNEGCFNELHLNDGDCLVADRVPIDGIEVFDIAYYNDKNLYLIQVKDGLGASTRDACSQLRNSAKLIEESIKSNDHQKIKEFYQRLKNTKILYSRTQGFKKQLEDIGCENNFLDLFLKRKITYVLAFRHGDDEDDIIRTESNIAKFEILGLRDNIKLFGSSSFKLYQIEKQ